MAHEHTIAWACEGPLWFCACGVEFYPKAKTLVVLGKRRTHRFTLTHSHG